MFGIKLIKKIHEYYGHIGMQQMLNKIRPHYYFKNMDTMVEKFCKECNDCIENKSRRGRVLGLSSQLGPATRPYQIMSVDTIGGFAGNNSKKKNICTFSLTISQGLFSVQPLRPSPLPISLR